MYCEKCSCLFDGNDRNCPVCGSKKIRYPRVDDPCFLVEKEAPWGEMLADVLTRNDVPFRQKPVLGAGLSLRLGQGMERYRFYVPFAEVEKAREMTEVLFGPEETE